MLMKIALISVESNYRGKIFNNIWKRTALSREFLVNIARNWSFGMHRRFVLFFIITLWVFRVINIKSRVAKLDKRLFHYIRIWGCTLLRLVFTSDGVVVGVIRTLTTW